MAELRVLPSIKPLSQMLYEREQEAFNRRMMERQMAAKEQAAMGGGNDPASVREWQFYSSMPVEEQRKYLQMKRADQIMNLGGAVAVRNPMGGIDESYPVSPKPQDMPDFRSDVAEQEAAARERGKARQEAISNLPKIEAKGQYMIDLLEKVRKHPGMEASVGVRNPFGGALPFGFNVPATPAADFDALMKQIGGEQFLQAYETLKGGGQITEIEGEQARNAIARMQTSQTEEAFLEALSEFQYIVRKGIERARIAAGQQSDPLLESREAINGLMEQGFNNPNMTLPPAPPQNLYEQAEREFDERKNRSGSGSIRPGHMEDGYVFMGGDPANPSSWKRMR